MTIKILADHIMFISLHNSQREYSKMSGVFLAVEGLSMLYKANFKLSGEQAL